MTINKNNTQEVVPDKWEKSAIKKYKKRKKEGKLESIEAFKFLKKLRE